ncbi:helix-turn-helix domain-containing protein [Prolixibacteraceae bacterium Z1-6]|uniref:Helix-turn-helix domain-containing protein n=1 Tax=Draconibacterium aestuarii TaxID=2998507 RepID=A0A9X3FAF0_9BACT|nr:helix-turn-helix domain-containing protein [Prolixibacteraceae bacterium Z1-6]
MLLFLSFLGIFLSLILLLFNARKYKSSLYLGLFFFLISLYGFYQYILLYSKSVTLISLFLFNLSVAGSPVYLIGPMLFWYTRSVLTDDAKLKRIDLWHFLPAIVFFVSALPNALVPWHEKVEVAKTVAQNQSFIMEYKATLLSEFLSSATIFLMRLILVLAYTIWSFGLFINYLVKKKISIVLSKQQFMKKWLCYLLGFMLILVISQLFMVFKSFEMHFSAIFFTFNFIRVISVVGLVGLLISPFFFPTILYGLPRMPEINEPENDDRQLNETKLLSNSFESDYLKSIGQKSDSFMEKGRLYLDPDCNLGFFAKQIDVPAHHLAYYFREIKKQRFNDFRNEWRINHAKALIQEGKANEVTLEAIGMQSGFSSRNAFISDFKKTEGVSPGAYAARYN